MIYRKPPIDFSPKFEVVSCYLEYQGKILLLHRLSGKSEGNKWGVPAGKIDGKENPEEAMSREMREETGITPERSLTFLEKVFVRYPKYDFVYYIFRMELDALPKVALNPEEHQSFQWLTPQECLAQNLVRDLDACLKMTYSL